MDNIVALEEENQKLCLENTFFKDCPKHSDKIAALEEADNSLVQEYNETLLGLIARALRAEEAVRAADEMCTKIIEVGPGRG